MRNLFPNNQIKGHLVLGGRGHNHAADLRIRGETSSSETERRHRKRLEAVLQMLSIRFLIKRDQMKGNPSLSLSQVVGETPVNFNVEALKQAARLYIRKFKERKRSQAHFISDHWVLEDMVDDQLAEDMYQGGAI